MSAGIRRVIIILQYLRFFRTSVKLAGVRILRYIRGMADSPVPERLKALRMRADVSMAAAAAACGFKTASGYQHYEDPKKFAKRYLPSEICEKLAPLFAGRAAKGEVPVTEDDVWALAGFASTPHDAGRPVVIVEPETGLLRTPLVPIYSAAQGGKGHIIIDFNPIEQARPPDELIRVRDAYGILIVGESMVPAYKPGDVAWVNPYKPIERDTDVVLYHVPPHGEAEAIIKTLIGVSERHWKLRQYQPPRDFTESKVDWTVCHRIVGKRNVR
jgi:phage repressor protein C with HTH and peptisase S24 domain